MTVSSQIIRSPVNPGRFSPVNIAVIELKECLSREKIEYIDFWSESITSEDLKAIWWINLIYGEHKLLFTLLLLKQYNLQKPKLLSLLKSSFSSELDDNIFVQNILSSCALPHILSDFVFTNPEYIELEKNDSSFSKYREYLDFSNIKRSINELYRKINPQKEFEKGKINIMSIHKSKGLESDFVIINGLVNGILPNKAKGLDSLEAQRRLLFVGMTRAIVSLFLITTVEWSGPDAHKVDFSQFKFDYRKKVYDARASQYIEEINH